MTEADDPLEAMQSWLTGLSATDEAVDDSTRLEREVMALLALAGLQAGERFRIEAPQPLAEAYVTAFEGAIKAVGATLSAADEVDVLVSFEAALGLEGAAQDTTLMRGAALALRPDGRYVIDLPNREAVLLAESQNRVFSAANGQIYLERSEFDYASGQHRVTVSELGFDGSRREA